MCFPEKKIYFACSENKALERPCRVCSIYFERCQFLGIKCIPYGERTWEL